jgi:hypothetical protein
VSNLLNFDSYYIIMAGGDGCGRRRVIGVEGRTSGRITNFFTKAED